MKDLETMVAERAAAVARDNGLSPDMEALLHTQFIAGYLASTEYQASSMNFGQAISAMGVGCKVRRAVWPVGAFMWLKPAANIQPEWCKDPTLKELAFKCGGSIKAQSVLCAYVYGEIVSGFPVLADDMMAEDWELAAE